MGHEPARRICERFALEIGRSVDLQLLRQCGVLPPVLFQGVEHWPDRFRGNAASGPSFKGIGHAVPLSLKGNVPNFFHIVVLCRHPEDGHHGTRGHLPLGAQGCHFANLAVNVQGPTS